ncbi:MAG: DNA double-strand break repair nuclease NurA [Armatimonadetes bacterium]|nr:DNA double-strand break repair nuclease NurA [Armatimonadota bacterium]
MLELSQVVMDIGRMGAEARKRQERLARQMQSALTQARLDDTEWASAMARQQGNKPPWAVADCRGRAPGVAHVLPAAPPDRYTALATDGSQIPLDRHAVAPCYLLNVGEIALHYGSGERPRLTSKATLHYKDDEVYQEGGEGVPLSDKIIANRRLLAESAALADLIRENQGRCALALVDDPLILWTPQGESEAEQRRVIDEFCQMLKAAAQADTPVAGYVSRPGHKDVVGALRLTLCPENCPHDAKSPCAALASLTDAQLFAALLTRPGDRSPVFGSPARVLSLYPADQQIAFFYLNAGTEIARVEIPQWVEDDPQLLDRTHVLCHDQAGKGQGYPVALSEAHERAVVRAPERDAFFRLVEAAFVRESVPALTTRKALAKRTRVL